jgi:hypothetical protein
MVFDPLLPGFQLTSPSICVLGDKGVSSQSIPQSVWDALKQPDGNGGFVVTVQQLLDLANDALGGLPLPSGVTYSDVGGAAGTINEVFDECRTAIPCDLF